jgi:hypothetical protein
MLQDAMKWQFKKRNTEKQFLRRDEIVDLGIIYV